VKGGTPAGDGTKGGSGRLAAGRGARETFNAWHAITSTRGMLCDDLGVSMNFQTYFKHGPVTDPSYMSKRR
jgi:hypothetical protein